LKTPIIRHNRLRNEELITPYGNIKFDDLGYATNLDDITADKEQLLSIPNLIDGEAFPAPEDVVKRAQAAAAQPTEPKLEVLGTSTVLSSPSRPSEPSRPTYDDEAYYKVILEAEAIKKNGAGYADTPTLLALLRQKDMPPIAGGKVREITDLARKSTGQVGANASG